MLFNPMDDCKAQMRIYKSLHWVTYLLRAFLLFSILFSAPEWCKALGNEMDPNCEFYGTDTHIVRSPMPVLRSPFLTAGVPFAIFIMVMMRLWKFRLIKYDADEYKVCALLSVIAIIYVTDFVLDHFNIINAPIEDILLI